MYLTPVGRNRVMKTQQVRGFMPTGLAALLKVALAPMSPTPENDVQVQQIPIESGDDLKLLEQQLGNQASQPQQQQPAGPQAQQPESPQQQAQTEQQEAQKEKQNHQTVLKLREELGQMLEEAGFEYSPTYSPDSLQVIVPLKPMVRIKSTGETKPANVALKPVINWAIQQGMKIQEIVKPVDQNSMVIDPKKSKPSNFVFSWTPKATKETDNELPYTEVNRDPQAHGAQNRSRMGGDQMPQQKAAMTLPEMLNLRKKALVEQLSKYAQVNANAKTGAH